MVSDRREQLRRQYVARVCETLRRYVLEGHRFQLHTFHGDRPEESRVSFSVLDWAEFARMLESPDGRDAPPLDDASGDQQD